MRVRFAQEFGASLFDIETANDLKDALKQASQRMGFDHFALSLEARASDDADTEMLLHDYPDEWAKVYTSFDLAGRDPVRRACDQAFGGFTWEAIGQLIPMTRGDRQMLAVGRECGIGDGFTIPRHLPGMARGTLTFVVAPDRCLPHRWLVVAEYLGTLALTSALKISDMARPVALPRLSDRQRECLLWVARGKTAAETAIILGISSETVIQHLKMARERYEVHCSQSLILAALFDGLIGFGDVFKWQGNVKR
ncbi:MAG: LuxR family quorum-sensing system transcriptional regulator CciR [Parasphingorhabdus sp.]|jgi:LuxR family quorum-sensing system transcriptional regulator CciR|uniref:LuxR family transcriptional regulator n=1 Tax=Sphingomonadales TaxID=204457 RepID=UPI0015666D8E|nr:LuxR family transcriptional regulator [Sphingopyxis sp. BSNA05]NRD88488.1 LuxR family transcriptional regulator [Sphingopyxis sp. BSNA05]|tara:strand:- start:22055 stop:22813 length:759 start_codon:yes stop_codon:yes gene_type:complete